MREMKRKFNFVTIGKKNYIEFAVKSVSIEIHKKKVKDLPKM